MFSFLFTGVGGVVGGGGGGVGWGSGWRYRGMAALYLCIPFTVLLIA